MFLSSGLSKYCTTSVPLHEIIHRASLLLDIAELVDAFLGDSVLVDAVQIDNQLPPLLY
jgi:hypothetical protein